MDLVNHLPDRLLFAVPKKGRLYEKCCNLLNGADIMFRRSHRLDIALSTNLPIALIFLPAADIPTFVGEGNCDVGITGWDQIEEADMFNQIDDLLDLQFGSCKLQIQVPETQNYVSSKDIVGKKIVSSFTHLTTQHFMKLEGVTEASDLKTKIKYVGGSVEASCALGVAEAIVDLVESGETMRAAGLKAIETILDTSAHLISSKNPKFPELVQIVRQRLEGVLTAQKFVLCTYNAPRAIIADVLQITPGKRAPTISQLEPTGNDTEEWVAISSMVESKKIGNVMDQLKSAGASDILVFDLRNCRA